ELNRLVCPTMDVFLDRAVSFSQLHRDQTVKAGGNRDEKPHVKRVVCHRGATENAGLVTFANNAWRNGRAVRFSQIEAPELTLENASGEVTTSGGPGLMKLFQLGDPLETTTSPRPERVSPAEQVFRLTRVEFAGPMHANNHDKIQSATFSGPVRVAHA